MRKREDEREEEIRRERRRERGREKKGEWAERRRLSDWERSTESKNANIDA